MKGSYSDQVKKWNAGGKQTTRCSRIKNNSKVMHPDGILLFPTSTRSGAFMDNQK